MNRRSAIVDRRSPVGLLALCLLLAVACSSGSEQFILGEFFGACRLRDRTALQGFATVPFEPHVQGIITSFTIARVSPEDAGRCPASPPRSGSPS